jgi:hypothetical protein
VYDSARGRRNAGFSQNVIASNLGLAEELADPIAQYLVEEGLLEWFSMGHLAITHRGIVEIETGIETPNQPTDHFPAVTEGGVAGGLAPQLPALLEQLGHLVSSAV